MDMFERVRGGPRTTMSPWKLKNAARKLAAAAYSSFTACGASFSRPPPPSPPPQPLALDTSSIPNRSDVSPTNSVKEATEPTSTTASPGFNSKNLCAICLDPLTLTIEASPCQAIFTAQCSHAFHFACISSNVRHGNVSCPICRAHWTQLPRNLYTQSSVPCNQTDPVLRILDDSIATFRVHRRSFLRAARYDDDEPIDPDEMTMPNCSRLDLSLVPVPTPPEHSRFHPISQVNRQASLYHSREIASLHQTSSSTSLHSPQPPPAYLSPSGHPQMSYTCSSRKAYLSVRLAPQRATDLVLVASPNGPHLRLLKQAMVTVVFSLRQIDRLAVVTYSSAAARVFPLKRMTTYGKRAALQVIDRLFYTGQADPMEGLRKGIKILDDRVHKNPNTCILHLSDSATRTYHAINSESSAPIYKFHVGFSFGASSGYVMHEFEEFLARILGNVVRDIQLSIRDKSKIVKLGELRGFEDRRIILDLGDSKHVNLVYSYIEGNDDECIRTGEVLLSIDDKTERNKTSDLEGRDISIVRRSSVDGRDCHDPYMARRWAKHLHGYRL